jgi:hypothetical protein
MNRVLGLAIVSLSLVSCGVNSAAPLAIASQKLESYFEAKHEFARELQKTIGGNTGSNAYRLVALNGPAYPVGSLISVNNSLDLESRDCVIPDAELPAPETWSGLPRWEKQGKLDVGLGLPSIWQSALSGGESTLDAGMTLATESVFQIEDISQVFLSRGELRRALANRECGATFADIPDDSVIFVRGLVYGRETLRSAKAFEIGVDVTIVKQDSADFSLSYGSNGAFELQEDTIVPKFAIVTLLSISESGTPDLRTGADDRTRADDRFFDFVAPSDDAIRALESKSLR